MSDKVELVEKHKDKYGLNMCCRALGLSKGTLAYRRGRASCSQTDAHLKAEIVRSTAVSSGKAPLSPAAASNPGERSVPRVPQNSTTMACRSPSPGYAGKS